MLADNRSSKQDARESILPANRKLTSWQAFDSWFWINSQSVFQAQARVCAEWLIGGKEHYLVVFRLVAFLMLTVEGCLDMYSHGGPWADIRYVTKWGFWMTWICFAAGLFSIEPPATGDKALLKKFKYSPWRAWKWQTLLFEIALTFQIMITIVYWTLLFKSTFQPGKTLTAKFSLVLDHFLPLLLLLIEYLLFSNPVFLKRHAYVVLGLLIIYTPINMGYSLFG